MSVLTDALRLYCKLNNIGVREIGRVAGTSHTMAARFLRGEAVGSDHFAKILIWAMSTPSRGEAETVPPKIRDGAIDSQ